MGMAFGFTRVRPAAEGPASSPMAPKTIHPIVDGRESLGTEESIAANCEITWERVQRTGNLRQPLSSKSLGGN